MEIKNQINSYFVKNDIESKKEIEEFINSSNVEIDIPNLTEIGLILADIKQSTLNDEQRQLWFLLNEYVISTCNKFMEDSKS